MDKIIKLLRQFNQARDWEKFHTPKNLAMAIGIEASELQEIFLWSNDENYNWMEHYKEEISEEIADIFISLCNFCDKMGIDEEDLNIITRYKIRKNEIKYPVDKAKGNCKKYTRL